MIKMNGIYLGNVANLLRDCACCFRIEIIILDFKWEKHSKIEKKHTKNKWKTQMKCDHDIENNE